MNKYTYLPLSDVEKFIPQMEKLKVSEIARGKNGFIQAYKNGQHKNDFWVKKRNSFIARVLPAYLKKKTPRRYLSLIAWAYKPIE
jgi:hypothetical protein